MDSKLHIWISGDNGNTWTALTNSDATDGDNSYTITSDEVGKQFRGVVSYLDGYGSYESLSTYDLTNFLLNDPTGYKLLSDSQAIA